MRQAKLDFSRVPFCCRLQLSAGLSVDVWLLSKSLWILLIAIGEYGAISIDTEIMNRGVNPFKSNDEKSKAGNSCEQDAQLFQIQLPAGSVFHKQERN